MAIRSKVYKRKIYTDVEPVFDCRTGRFTGDVMAIREDIDALVTLKVSTIRGDTEEEQAMLNGFAHQTGPVDRED